MRVSKASLVVLAIWATGVLSWPHVFANDVPDLSGRWAMMQIYPQTATLPFAGEVLRTSTVLQLVDVEQDGTALTLRDVYCHTDIDDGTSLVKTTIPSAFMQSLRPATRTATLVAKSTVPAWRFVQPPYVEVRGAMLASPETDPLPDDPEDPRVFDQDGDGEPGLTVQVTILGIVEGRTFLVQRVRYALDGAVLSNSAIDGSVVWSDEQSVLGATNPLLLVNTESAPDPHPEKHMFIMRRVEEGMTCERLLETWREIFGIEQTS